MGTSKNFGSRAALRVDYSFRDFRDFYVARTDTATGNVTNRFGQRFDLTFIENSNVYKRRYQGVTAQGTYRFDTSSDIGVTYTASKAWGNFDAVPVVRLRRQRVPQRWGRAGALH